MQSSGSVANLLPSLERFADTLSEAYGSQLRAHAEDPLKAPVSELLQSFASTLGFSRLLARPEAPVSGVGRSGTLRLLWGLLCGYVELTAPCN